MSVTKILVVMPDGEKVHANLPVEPEAWTFADGQEFFDGLMQKAFPAALGVRRDFVMSVERAQGGWMVAVSIEHRTMTIGPFNPSVEGLEGLRSAVDVSFIERKDITRH